MNLQPDRINPFILTLSINEEADSFFNRQRQQYFPADLNFLKAHLTLFHYLPMSVAEIVSQIKLTAKEITAFEIQVTDVVSLGKGVAYKLESKELQQLHSQLQRIWKPFLKPQDLQKLWPHITVQNKVTPQQAKELLAQLKTDFEPFTIKGVGFALWEYLNGPWKFVDLFNLSSETHP